MTSLGQLGRDFRAVALLTTALFRRLSREGIVVRSLTFPIGLVIGTLVLTIGVVAYIRFTPVVALTANMATPALIAELEENEFRPLITETPKAVLDDNEAWAATDGETLWLRGGGPQTLVVEALIRERINAPWRPNTQVPKPDLSAATAMGRNIVVLLGVLFSLYGVVFGAGMVARDRDDFTFEVELSLGVSRWVHGVVRILAGSSILAAFLCLGVALCTAILGLDDPAAMVRHAIACATGATCIGLLAIGRSGIQSGFTGALALGMSLATACFALGAALPSVGQWIPMASLVAGESSGWQALVGTGVLALAALLVFTRRSAAV